ncbi:hypothetical protein ABZW10_28250 [Kitasatospora sp. NPDC004723]|uniref:hypothetical protein n=1 Tax=Kitasatospora sp. NPDC004723 TaxID=3154288 RepID=UPI0033B7E63B
MPEYKLPSDSELSERFIKGKTDSEIAAEFGTTRQAVSYQRNKLGFQVRPFVTRANDIISRVWKVQVLPDSQPGSHHQTSLSQSLRVWLRLQLGDPSLSARQRQAAINFETRLREQHVVLVYDPDGGFDLVPREPTDGDSVIRWPDQRPRDPEAVKYLSLPGAPTV